MDNRHYKRFGSSANSYTNGLRSIPLIANSIQKLTSVRRSALKASAIPFAVLSSTFIDSLFNKAHAETAKEYASNSMFPIFNNPFEPMVEAWDKVVDWFKEIPNNITDFSIELMADLYELSTNLIFKTPLWIFDNDWFQNTTYKFSLFSIGIVSVLTIIESIKKMTSGFSKKSKNHMDLKTIAKRWGIVSGALTVTPFLFLKSFELLNFVSGTINAMGAQTVDAVKTPESVKLFDVATVLVFDIILLSSMIPLLWKNGRRFFDIMVLGVVSPFALTAWIFDPYKHLFRQWWDNLKHLSLVQIYYAVFLLIIGWFLFGTPTPDTFEGMIIKMLVVVGGFARMVDPPRIVSRHLDHGGGLDELWSKNIRKIKNEVRSSFALTKGIVRKPLGAVKSLWRASNPSARVVSGNTRMKRYHNK